jgi:hypothetical protein
MRCLFEGRGSVVTETELLLPKLRNLKKKKKKMVQRIKLQGLAHAWEELYQWAVSLAHMWSIS